MKKLLIYLCIAVLGLVFVLYFISKRKPKCTPKCEKGKCGQGNGCGGPCLCPTGEKCVNGNCCSPTCEQGKCGLDGCGGLCVCPKGSKCVNGVCCTPNCGKAECGSDGCGGSCGTCSAGLQCYHSLCSDIDVGTVTYTNNGSLVTNPFTLGQQYLADAGGPLTLNAKINISSITVEITGIILFVWIYISDDQGNMPPESQVFNAYVDKQYTFPWQIQANSPKKFTILNKTNVGQPLTVTFTDIY